MKDNSLLKGNAFFEKYIRKNFVKYILILMVYLTGFLLGIGVFNNNINKVESSTEISFYVTEKLEGISSKNSEAIGSYIQQDFFEFIVISVLSFSIIGIPVIVILLFIKALSLGVTVSALIYSSGISSGLSFSILIFMIPTLIKMFALLVTICSSLKFIENILKYKKEIKYELVRHAFTILIIFLMFCAVAVYRCFSLNLVDKILFWEML